LPDLGHRHQTSVCDWSRSVWWTSRDGGPRKRVPEIICVETYIKKDLIHERVHACGVYNTFGSSTRKYSLEAPRPKSARVFGESCCMAREELGHLHNIWIPQRWYPGDHTVRLCTQKKEDFVRLLC